MPRKKKIPPKYEDYSDIIDVELAKRRKRWTLTAINFFNYDDIEQVVRFHIFKKLYQFDETKGPFSHWCSKIISNQIKNIVRNNYDNYKRPCLGCAAAEGADLCRIYGKQCNACPLYKKWEKRKKQAYDTKLPVSINELENGLPEKEHKNYDIEKGAKAIHEKMKTILKDKELAVYTYLYIDEKDEEGLADFMNYRTNEKNRKAGYKMLMIIRKSIINKVKKVLYSGEIDI